MKTPSIKQLAAATAATAPVAAHVTAAHQAVEPVPPVVTVRLNFDVPRDLHIAVKTKAAASGRTMKDILLEFLQEYTQK